jgi:DNA (cytosine-5)-methyltransferase 1
MKNLSLFSGAGGMDIGLEAAGFDPIACLEFDQDARATLSLNRPLWNVLSNGDVVRGSETIRPKDFGLEPGELDLISGGPPCQPFSVAGQWAQQGRRGMADSRAETVHALLRYVAAFRPRSIMLENVHGFVSGPNSALPAITEGLRQINQDHGTSYLATWKLLNAADFGVPQNRRRVILVAFRDDDELAWPAATHAGNPVTVGEALQNAIQGDAPPATGKWAELLPSIPPGQNYQWLTSKGGGEQLFGYRTKFWNFLLKLNPSAPSWTLSASPGPSTGPFHWENRPLIAREMMRIQTIPDEWELAGDTRTQTRLAGNATPALLAEVIGNAIRSVLSQTPPAGNEYAPILALRRTPVSLRVEQPRAVPEKYRHLIGSKTAHPGTGRGPAPRTSEAAG